MKLNRVLQLGNPKLSELFQHEYDHLDGILATQRAIDDKSFKCGGSFRSK